MGKPKRQLMSFEDASLATGQHKKPCTDCPWARTALPGWLGSTSAVDWLRSAHSDGVMECHTLLGAQCAGAAIYRANVCKKPRDPEALRLPENEKLVFSTPMQFVEYHAQEPGKLK